MARFTKFILASAACGCAFALAPLASAEDGIPNFASKDFGWQSNIEDWQAPPEGSGHGPMANDPAYPYLSNAEGARQGKNPTVRITNTKDPILKPATAADIEKTNQELLKGEKQIPFTAQARCYPGGVPGQLLWPFEPFYFIQTPTEVWMIWQRDHWIRRVKLNAEHSANPTPSWFGESVGHYENGDTLVVDTIGLQTHSSYIDNFRTSHSEKLHVVERFKIEADGQHLTAIARVEDPEAYNAPLTMTQHWFKVNLPMAEVVCAENNEDFFHQGLVDIPRAEKPDF